MVPREFGGSRRKRGGGGKRVVEEAWEFDVWGGGGFGVSVSESSEDASPYEAIRASILSGFFSYFWAAFSNKVMPRCWALNEKRRYLLSLRPPLLSLFPTGENDGMSITLNLAELLQFAKRVFSLVFNSNQIKHVPFCFYKLQLWEHICSDISFKIFIFSVITFLFSFFFFLFLETRP